MPVFQIVKDSPFTNLHTFASLDPSLAVTVTNTGVHTFFVAQSALAPTSLQQAVPVLPGKTVFLNANSLPAWIAGGSVSSYAQISLLGQGLENYDVVDLPNNLYTSREKNFGRLRVDSAQTSFFTGHQGRSFKEISLASGATYLIKISVNVDTVLWNLNLTVDSGSLRLATYSGGSPSVTPTEVIPAILKNTMSYRQTPYYALQNELRGGLGTLSGGTLIDVIRVTTANATSQQVSVGSSPFSERGVGVGDYYWVINNPSNGTATGILSAFWEERI